MNFKLVSITKRGQCYWIGGVILAAIALNYLCVVQVSITEFHNISDKYKILSNELAERNRIINNWHSKQKQIAEQQLSYQATFKDAGSLLAEISTLANRASLTVSTSSVLASHNEGQWLLHPLEISLEGEYQNLITFLQELQKLPNCFVIAKLKIESIPETPTAEVLRMIVDLQFYQTKNAV